MSRSRHRVSRVLLVMLAASVAVFVIIFVMAHCGVDGGMIGMFVAFGVLALAPGAVLRLAVERTWVFAGILLASHLGAVRGLPGGVVGGDRARPVFLGVGGATVAVAAVLRAGELQMAGLGGDLRIDVELVRGASHIFDKTDYLLWEESRSFDDLMYRQERLAGRITGRIDARPADISANRLRNSRAARRVRTPLSVLWKPPPLKWIAGAWSTFVTGLPVSGSAVSVSSENFCMTSKVVPSWRRYS